MENVHGWEVNRDTPGADQMWLAPLDGPDDTFRENVGVVLGEAPERTDHRTYLDQLAEQVQTNFQVKNSVAYSKTELNNLEAYKAHFRLRLNDLDLTHDSYIIFDGAHIYTIACCALQPDYVKYKPKFEKMLNTFSLK